VLPAKRKATYDDLLLLPEHVVGEIIAGDLIVSPRPASRHARAAYKIASAMEPFDGPRDGGPGGWWFLFEPELHLHTDVLVPDVAGWRQEKMPELADVVAFEQPPDWICEVLSPSTAKVDRARKMEVYARFGVGHAWLVDPVDKTLEVYRLEHGSWLMVKVFADEVMVRAEPFDAVELDLSRWWMP